MLACPQRQMQERASRSPAQSQVVILRYLRAVRWLLQKRLVESL